MFKSKYFKLEEFLKSTTAYEMRIQNLPSFEAVENLNRLVETVLDPARAAFGAPIIVTSGFRNEILNREVGGVSNSQHLHGLAADITGYDLNKLFNILKNNKSIDQLIFEDNGHGLKWLHVSIAPKGSKARNMIINN